MIQYVRVSDELVNIPSFNTKHPLTSIRSSSVNSIPDFIESKKEICETSEVDEKSSDQNETTTGALSEFSEICARYFRIGDNSVQFKIPTGKIVLEEKRRYSLPDLDKTNDFQGREFSDVSSLLSRSTRKMQSNHEARNREQFSEVEDHSDCKSIVESSSSEELAQYPSEIVKNDAYQFTKAMWNESDIPEG
ncbi:hypothetical protein Avbf_04703 [Armadillidium vulgare]|nr:hypothetical protein Avbf_04703 [Armadillidium vulgare]